MFLPVLVKKSVLEAMQCRNSAKITPATGRWRTRSSTAPFSTLRINRTKAAILWAESPPPLAPNGQNDSKSRLAAHHPIIRLRDTLQGIAFIHRPHAGPLAECERVLRVDRRPGIPALHRAAARQQKQRRHLHRLGRPDDQ